MGKIINIKNIVFAVATATGSAVATLLGGWDIMLYALLVFMTVDYISGILVAGVFHNSGKSKSGALESRAGLKGIIRKCGVLGLIMVCATLDQVTGQHVVRTTVCTFFIMNEGLSILENIGLMGVQYPQFLRNALEVLKKKSDEGKVE